MVLGFFKMDEEIDMDTIWGLLKNGIIGILNKDLFYKEELYTLASTMVCRLINGIDMIINIFLGIS